MSTQRLGGNPVINSDQPGGTLRHQTSIISSMAPQPLYVAAPVLSTSLNEDIVLNGIRYRIMKQIARSGEAEVYLVDNNGNNFVLKYYYTQFKPKDEILRKLKAVRHPFIIALFDYGYYNDRFYEILEYARGGTLDDKTALSSLQKTREIVEQAIEGLNYCHTHGIIHRDIKPENIFYRTDNRREIALGDFGIASNLKEGEELVRTTMSRTSLYAAPELFTNIQGKTTIEKSVDYYALGMSLLHMWFGRDPFEDVDEFGIMRLKSEGRVQFPDKINPDVETLIKGLITVNPRERWGYDEVKKWLRGEDVKVFYQTVQFVYKPYAFGYIDGEQIVVNNPEDLVMYLEKYPDKGEGHLYRNTIAKWIEPVDPGLFNELMDIVERDFPTDRAAGLTKAIYILDQERPFRGMDKTKLRTQEEIAEHFEQHFDYFKQELQNPNAPFFIFLESRNYKENANEYRNYFKITNPEAALNTLIFKLEGADKFIIGEYTIYEPDELLKVDDKTMQQIIAQLSNSNSKLSIWINSFTKLHATLEKWHLLGRFDETTIRYALQQGFKVNNGSAANSGELFGMLKTNFSFFFPDNGDPKMRDEANYWLKNYMGTSLCQMVIDYLCAENNSDKEFTQMLEYATSSYEDTGLDLYQVIEFLMPYVKSKKSDNKKTGNKILISNIAEIFQRSFARFWDTVPEDAMFMDKLKEYIIFLEKNTTQYPDLFQELTLRLDDRIGAGFRRDFGLIKEYEDQTNTYRDDMAKVLTGLKQKGIDMPYLKRYNNENVYLNKFKQDNKLRNEKEKKEKIKITQGKFDNLLDKYKEKFKESIKDDVNYKIITYAAIGAIGIVFLIAVFVDNRSPLLYMSLPVIAFISLVGYRLGNFIGSRIARSYNDQHAIGAVIGTYVGMLAGNHYKARLVGYLPREKALVNIGFYKEVDNMYLYVFALLMAVLLALLILQVIARRNKEVGKVTLKAAEQDALNQNMVEIEKYFAEKELFDGYQEKVHIIRLDNPAFDKEFAKVK